MRGAVLLRSACFNLALYFSTAVVCMAALPLLALPRGATVAAMRGWSRWVLWLLRTVAGTGVRVRGRAHLPPGPALIAMQHQSMWDTIACTALLSDPAIVMKRELMWIPLYGWYAKKTGMIAVARSGGTGALRGMCAAAASAAAAGRPVVIFPQGARQAPGVPGACKPGVAALYRSLGLPCVPVRLDSGVFWPRRSFLRHPGEINLVFCAPIPPGLDRQAFMAALSRHGGAEPDESMATPPPPTNE